MAERMVFSTKDTPPFFNEELITFTWHPGLSIQQKQLNIADLHAKYKDKVPRAKILEISSKSPKKLGVALSAFNLKTRLKNGRYVNLENLYQASKVFESGGPFRDLLNCSAAEAKKDERLRIHGLLIRFEGEDGEWSNNPQTLYYDWIYLNALHSNSELSEAVKKYDTFTDIEFNSEKSINCQARAAALYVALCKVGEIDRVLAEPEYYRELRKHEEIALSDQISLF